MIPEAIALREALEDRLVVDALLRVLKGAPLSPDDHPEYARGLGRALAASGARDALVAAFRDGRSSDFAEVAAAIAAHPSAEVAHHLALLLGRFAATTDAIDLAHGHLERALELWLGLWKERAYLVGLANRIAGGEGDLLQGFADVLLDPLAADLRAGRHGPSPAARRALHGLRAVPACAEKAELPPELRAEIEAVAARLLGDVVREVLEEARLVAEQIDPLRTDPEERAAPFRLVLSFTSWAGLDPETIVFMLDQAHEQAWELYRARRMTDVRRLMDPLRPAVDELEARLARDVSLVAYRALCAQALVFFGETESDRRAAIAFLERAVAVCPTHRNARLILAGLLVEDATVRLAALPTIGIFGAAQTRRRGLAEVRRLRDRAIDLWPDVKIPPALATLDT